MVIFPEIQWRHKKSESNKLIIKTLSENPLTYFGTYELGNANDPRNQAEDLGDNAMKASAYGIKNLKYVLKNLPHQTVPNDGHHPSKSFAEL